jgi:hypothetical protein
MGRHRIHKDNAARQRAYRAREAAAKALAPAGTTGAHRAMTARVAKTVERIDSTIDTSALR